MTGSGLGATGCRPDIVATTLRVAGIAAFPTDGLGHVSVTDRNCLLQGTTVSGVMTEMASGFLLRLAVGSYRGAGVPSLFMTILQKEKVGLRSSVAHVVAATQLQVFS